MLDRFVLRFRGHAGFFFMFSAPCRPFRGNFKHVLFDGGLGASGPAPQRVGRNAAESNPRLHRACIRVDEPTVKNPRENVSKQVLHFFRMDSQQGPFIRQTRPMGALPLLVLPLRRRPIQRFGGKRGWTNFPQLLMLHAVSSPTNPNYSFRATKPSLSAIFGLRKPSRLMSQKHKAP